MISKGLSDEVIAFLDRKLNFQDSLTKYEKDFSIFSCMNLQKLHLIKSMI